jgi:cyclophilin family peptidyl-prolyl cis-trans isomerase
MVAYVGLGKYHFSAINRADDQNPGPSDDFVLQMGSFLGFPRAPDLWAQNLSSQSIRALKPVTTDTNGDFQVDFNSLSNTRGTVSLALSSIDKDGNPDTNDPVTNPNSGTSSFFINLGDNTFLDSSGFVPFARIDNMNTIDQIMQLTQRDLSGVIGQNGNLALTDVPLDSDGELVVVTAIQVLDPMFSFTGPIANVLKAQESATIAAAAARSASSAASSDAILADEPPPIAGGSATQAAVPEPATAALSIAALLSLFMTGRRANR